MTKKIFSSLSRIALSAIVTLSVFSFTAVDAKAEGTGSVSISSATISNDGEKVTVTASVAQMPQSDDGKRVYVHLLDYPFSKLELHGFAGKIDYAQFLHDGSELFFHDEEIADENTTITLIDLPVVKPNVTIPVIELFLKD